MQIIIFGTARRLFFCPELILPPTSIQIPAPGISALGAAQQHAVPDLTASRSTLVSLSDTRSGSGGGARHGGNVSQLIEAVSELQQLFSQIILPALNSLCE